MEGLKSPTWGCLKDVWMWLLGTQLRGGLGRGGLTVGLYDLIGTFQPKAVHDYIGHIQNIIHFIDVMFFSRTEKS